MKVWSNPNLQHWLQQDIGVLFGHLWHLLRAEVLRLVPQWREFLVAEQKPDIIIGLSANDQNGLVAQLASLQPVGSSPVFVDCSGLNILRRTISIPRAGRKLAEKAAMLKLVDQLPMGLEEVYFDLVPIAGDSKSELQFQAFVVKKSTIEADLALIKAHLGQAIHLGLIGPDGLVLARFEPKRIARDWRNLLFKPSVLASLFSFAALVVLVSIILARQQLALHGLTQKIAEWQASGQKTLALQAEKEILVARLHFLPNQMKSHDSGRLLSQLSQQLPDDTWLTQIEISPKSIRLQGYGKDASAVIPIVSGLSGFTNVRNLSPTVQLSNQPLQSFDIGADRKEVAP